MTEKKELNQEGKNANMGREKILMSAKENQGVRRIINLTLLALFFLFL